MKPIVIIGAGAIVEAAHLPAYRAAGFPVAAIVDPRPSAAERLARSFGIPQWATSFCSITNDKEALYDLAVPAAQIGNVLDQLPHGSHFLCQKPFGEDLAHAHQLLRLANERNLKGSVNFQLRYAPNVLFAKEAISAGRIGEPLEITVTVRVHTPWENWSFLKEAPRMEIVYHSIHYLDLLRALFGEPDRVMASTLKHPHHLDLDSVRTAAILEFGPLKRATLLTYHAHRWGKDAQESRIVIEGTEGCLQLQMGLNLDYPHGAEDTFSWAGSDGVWHHEPVVGKWVPDAFAGPMRDALAWADDPEKVPPTKLSDALKTMELVERCYDSAKRG